MIPTLFGSVEAVGETLEHLEVQFLANRGAHLHFAVLSDFTDAPTEHQEGDEAIVRAAVDGVAALNARYAGGGEEVFYLFHRARRWNPREGVWMGWERKRGKLAEFNQFVLGRRRRRLLHRGGRHQVDPRGPLRHHPRRRHGPAPRTRRRSLVGALAHPLNRAVYDPARGRVTRGYGVLQPRVGVSLPSAYRSLFAAIHSGHPGVDPYTTAVSDVYQDLYGEGSFTGKGVYEVEAFERATRGRFPENTLLSHDLIEGSYARAGLATDVVVYDDYPSRYLTYTRRKHRWIRGDWQLLPWLGGRVPGPDGPEPNRLSLLSRWKILDNLRRSTVEIAQLAFLVLGWTLLPGQPAALDRCSASAPSPPPGSSRCCSRWSGPPLDKSWRAYYAAVGRDARRQRQPARPGDRLPAAPGLGLRRRHRAHALATAGQPAPAAGVADGVADRAEPRARQFATVWRAMWPAVAIAAAVCSSRSLARPAERRCGRSRLRCSRCSWPGRSLPRSRTRSASRRCPASTACSSAGRTQAMRYALLHWRFFDRFVSAETSWLAPDNFQDDPAPVVAMRTSPTNIGLQLLATVSA